jgi:hypothetical protein
MMWVGRLLVTLVSKTRVVFIVQHQAISSTTTFTASPLPFPDLLLGERNYGSLLLTSEHIEKYSVYVTQTVICNVENEQKWVNILGTGSQTLGATPTMLTMIFIWSAMKSQLKTSRKFGVVCKIIGLE